MNQTTICAIPTKGPRGIQFRSRLEARWAQFFERLGLKWEYEPIDLKGYIPDFLIQLPNSNKTVLIEVKPDMIYGNLKDHCEKINQSGWKGPYIIVGSCLFKMHSLDEKYKEGIAEKDSNVPIIGMLVTSSEPDCVNVHTIHVPVFISKTKNGLFFNYWEDYAFIDLSVGEMENSPNGLYSYVEFYEEMEHLWYSIQNSYQYKNKK
jgi:hypothetical protein